MNTITIPVLDYKMDKIKAFILVAVIVLTILLITNPGGIISGLIKDLIGGVQKAIGGAIDTAGQAAAQATGVTGNSDTNSTASALLYNHNYFKAVGKNDPFSTTLYPQYSAASNLTYDQLTVAAKSVRDNMGYGILSINIGYGDASMVQAALVPCQTQTDVSNVCIVYAQLYGGAANMIADLCNEDDVLNVNNTHPAGDGSNNCVALQKLIQWANTLPVS